MTIAIITHFVVLIYWQSILDAIGRSKRIFFDKVCIHQTDIIQKSAGIANITGVLANSKELFIALDTCYFTRLWCPFEVAAFVGAKPQGSIVAVPVQIGSIAMCSSLLGFFTMLLTHFIIDIRGWDSGSIGFALVVLMCAMTIYVPLGFLAARYFKELEGLKTKLNTYSVKRAECFCCQHGHVHPDTGATILCDRELVYNSIAEWHGSGDREAGLRAFDSQIQSMWDDTITKKLGSVCMPYSFVLLTGMWHVMADLALAGMNRTTLDMWQLVYAADVFFLRLPLASVIVFVLAQNFYSWDSRLSIINNLMIGSTGGAFAWITTYTILDKDIGIAALLAWMAIECAILFMLYRSKWQLRGPQKKVATSSAEMQAPLGNACEAVSSSPTSSFELHASGSSVEVSEDA